MLGHIRITETFSTTAPPAAVWAALEAAPRWPQVQSDLIEARIEPDGRLIAGATIRTKAKPGTAAVDMSYRVVEAERPSRLKIEAASAGHFRSRTEYRIEPEGDGLVVRANGEPASIIGAVQRELKALLPTVGIEAVQTLDDIRASSLAPRTFAMRLLVGFAAVASLLTLAGVYSVLSLSVTARRREIAIRSAMGAARGAIMSMILHDGIKLIAGGIVIGLGIAVVLSRALETLLFGVGPADPATLAVAALAFVAVALLACCLPAARAARVEPAEALKGE